VRKVETKRSIVFRCSCASAVGDVGLIRQSHF